MKYEAQQSEIMILCLKTLKWIQYIKQLLTSIALSLQLRQDHETLLQFVALSFLHKSKDH